MKKRFIIIVLDGFGIGAMPDAAVVRPGDEKANTLRRLSGFKTSNTRKIRLDECIWT